VLGLGRPSSLDQRIPPKEVSGAFLGFETSTVPSLEQHLL
jgi:hypothetical protein